MKTIWFWQRIVSPHMGGLAVALAKDNYNVVYVAEQHMSDERVKLGWQVSGLQGVTLILASSKKEIMETVCAAPSDSIHICQGVRGNGLIRVAQRALAKRGLRHWVIMETIDDVGWRGLIKRIEYRRLFLWWKSRLQGFLAIGHSTPSWLMGRGIPQESIFPFAYFLPGNGNVINESLVEQNRFRILFVGQFIERKRLGMLIDALGYVNSNDIELTVIGSGPLEDNLRSHAELTLPGRVVWVGRLASTKVQREMAMADCVVLPSRHDGWGAVTSEALMVGTPVICSDTCGSAGVVAKSGCGGVFVSGQMDSLIERLNEAINKGPISKDKRIILSSWAECLGAEVGAKYLARIFEFIDDKAARPNAPWSD